MKSKCGEHLKKITGKKNIFFTDRGNTSILLALKLAKYLGKTKAFIQDQGGWITYGQYLRKLKFEIIDLETDSGIIKLNSLNDIDDMSLLLMNSMPGYHALQTDISEIEKICKQKNCFFINDVSGSIGKKEAKYGNIILGSFGEWKPVEIKYGGFLAFDETSYKKFFSENFSKELKDFYKELYTKLEELPGKLKKIDETVSKIKLQLKDFNVIHSESKGLNVIVRFNNDEEKMEILDFCKAYNYEFLLCPMYIKVLENAVSIEVMRL